MSAPVVVITPVHGSDKLYRLHEPTFARADGLLIKVSAGLVTDGASIPRLLWRVIGHPLQGRLLRGAIVHDALYQSHLLPRSVADRILRDVALQDGFPGWKTRMVYWAVSQFALPAWLAKDADTIALARALVEIHTVSDPLTQRMR